VLTHYLRETETLPWTREEEWIGDAGEPARDAASLPRWSLPRWAGRAQAAPRQPAGTRATSLHNLAMDQGNQSAGYWRSGGEPEARQLAGTSNAAVR
jgi:hypothetical protein